MWHRGWFGRATRLVQYGSALVVPAGRLPVVRRSLDALARRIQRSRTGPASQTIRSDVVAVARDASARELAAVHLTGGDPYSFTAPILARAAAKAAADGVRPAGALGSVEAFGAANLEAGCAGAGFHREPAQLAVGFRPLPLQRLVNKVIRGLLRTSAAVPPRRQVPDHPGRGAAASPGVTPVPVVHTCRGGTLLVGSQFCRACKPGTGEPVCIRLVGKRLPAGLDRPRLHSLDSRPGTTAAQGAAVGDPLWTQLLNSRAATTTKRTSSSAGSELLAFLWARGGLLAARSSSHPSCVARAHRFVCELSAYSAFEQVSAGERVAVLAGHPLWRLGEGHGR
jgi:hypothetical protein